MHSLVGASEEERKTTFRVPTKCFQPLILTCAFTLSCKRDIGSLLCLITTRYGSFCTAPISSWNFWRDDCLITRVLAEMQSVTMLELMPLGLVSNEENMYYLLSHTAIGSVMSGRADTRDHMRIYLILIVQKNKIALHFLSQKTHNNPLVLIKAGIIKKKCGIMWRLSKMTGSKNICKVSESLMEQF